jgi:hypothetical protein
MQVVDRVVNVERSAAFSETGFKIKASAKAFKILSSGLYSDKIRAIVRELGTNAADSHIMAGYYNQPFHVHLPNHLEPWFSLRDFGTGLSPQDIEGIYTTYFESNKTTSNDVTGCLGLGSKSPFSYTDNFTVTSYFNGKKYLYTAFMNEHGLPSVANLSEEDTQERNGIEVAFPVEPENFGEFGEKAALVYSYFDVPPVITGQTVDLKLPEPTYQGNNWKLYRNLCNHRLIMGNVAYPVNLYNAGVTHPLFQNIGIDIRCKIGEAEMTASREALEYTTTTKKTIQDVCKAATDMWETLVIADLASQPTYWDACLFYDENQLWLRNRKDVTWKGKPVDITIKLPKSINYSYAKDSYGRKVDYRANQWTTQIRVDSHAIFVEDDLPRGTKLRAMNFVRITNDKPKLYILSQTDIAEVVTILDIPANKVMKASQLPKLVRPKNTNAGKKCVYRFNTCGTNNRNFWETVELKDCPDGGIYVMLDKWTIEEYQKPDRFVSIIERLRSCGISIPNNSIYGVRKNILKKIQGNPKWVSVKDIIAKLQQKYLPDLDLIVNCHDYVQYKQLTVFKDKVKDVDIADLLVKIESVSKNFTLYSNLRTFVMDMPEVSKVNSTCKDVEAIKQKYPLLFYIMEKVTYDFPVNDLVNYINLVNKE